MNINNTNPFSLFNPEQQIELQRQAREIAKIQSQLKNIDWTPIIQATQVTHLLRDSLVNSGVIQTIATMHKELQAMIGSYDFSVMRDSLNQYNQQSDELTMMNPSDEAVSSLKKLYDKVGDYLPDFEDEEDDIRDSNSNSLTGNQQTLFNGKLTMNQFLTLLGHLLTLISIAVTLAAQDSSTKDISNEQIRHNIQHEETQKEISESLQTIAHELKKLNNNDNEKSDTD